MDESQNSYEIKISRSGVEIPVVNGIHLHSVYNPTKEAEAFIENYTDKIQSSSSILILGLGFGFHVQQALRIAKEYHPKVHCVVIEPDQWLVENYCSRYSTTDFKIICEKDVEKVYSDPDVVNLLLNKPVIIKHDASFNSNLNYYKSILTYRADQSITKTRELIIDDNLFAYLASKDHDSSDELINSIIESKKIKDPEEFFLLGFQTLINDHSDLSKQGML